MAVCWLPVLLVCGHSGQPGGGVDGLGPGDLQECLLGLV
jgi:hypothetical protein